MSALRKKCDAHIARLQNDLAADVKKLKGFKNKYRLRAGNYRILFEVEGGTMIVYDVSELHSLLAPSAWIGHSLDMGKVVVKIKLTNQGDLVAAQRKLSKAKPRTVEAEALVDTGATRLYLQSSLIKALGLRKESEVQSKTTNGVRRRAVFESVRLELMGRNGAFQVVEVDDDVPNLLGQIPLEYLDFVVDPRGQKLIPNPEHGDKQMSEEY
jgi:predicted aspartyl protease